MIQEIATVLFNKHIHSGYGKIGLLCGDHYQHARPGQFVTLRFPRQTTPLLRRPFSIHRLVNDPNQGYCLEILYKIIGPFTQKLHDAQKGDPVDLLGPLGHGFTLLEKHACIALVAGGIGIAPLVFLHDTLHNLKGLHKTSAVFIGGKTRADILCKSLFDVAKIKVFTATEDGSEGETGFVTAPLARWLKRHRPEMMYACGPMPMLKAVIAISHLEKIPCEVSVETIMACGMGACLGCAVQTRNNASSYRHVCVDGPVFSAADLNTS